MSRLVIDVTGEQHQQIKIMASLQGITIKDFVMEKLFSDDDAAAMKELSTLLFSRIKEAENGGISSKTMRQVAEEKAKELGVL